MPKIRDWDQINDRDLQRRSRRPDQKNKSPGPCLDFWDYLDKFSSRRRNKKNPHRRG